MVPPKRRVVVIDVASLVTTNATALIEKAVEAAVVDEATAVIVAVARPTRKTPTRSLHHLQLRLPFAMRMVNQSLRK